MAEQNRYNSLLLGAAFIIGMIALGYMLGGAVISFKEFERTVTVKGLSEHEYPADVVIWPIQFVEADNDLGRL